MYPYYNVQHAVLVRRPQYLDRSGINHRDFSEQTLRYHSQAKRDRSLSHHLHRDYVRIQTRENLPRDPIYCDGNHVGHPIQARRSQEGRRLQEIRREPAGGSRQGQRFGDRMPHPDQR